MLGGKPKCGEIAEKSELVGKRNPDPTSFPSFFTPPRAALISWRSRLHSFFGAFLAITAALEPSQT